MRPRTGICLLALFICGILFYSFSWSNPFVFDDVLKIQENSDLKPGSSIAETLLYPYTQNATNLLRNDPSRPLTFLIYRLCYQIGTGQPWPFHAASSLFHTVNAMLVFLLTALVARRGFKSESVAPGLFAGFLFLLLPLNSGTVLYAFAFSDVIATFFILSALYIFAKSPDVHLPAFAGTLFLFLCALFSKQSALVLPALLVATDLIINPINRQRVHQYLGFATIAVLYVVFRYVFFGGIGDLEGAGNTYAPLDYLKLEGPMILKYLWLALIPTELTIDHAPVPANYSLWQISFAWSLILLLTFASLKVLFSKNSSERLNLSLMAARVFAWFWLFFIVTLAPTSSFVPTVDLFVERRAYLGSFALAALFGLLLNLIPKKRVGAIAGSVILVLFAIVSWGRVQIYGNPESLWLEAVHHYKHSKRANVNLAYTYDQLGRYEDARKIYEEVLAQYPNDAFVFTKIALIYQNPRYPAYNIQKSFEYYRKALELNPNDIVTLYNAGLLMLDAGNYDQAEKLFRHTLDINPRFIYGLFGLGMTLIKQGKKSEGFFELQKSLNIDPNFTPAQDQLRQLKIPRPSTR